MMALGESLLDAGCDVFHVIMSVSREKECKEFLVNLRVSGRFHFPFEHLTNDLPDWAFGWLPSENRLFVGLIKMLVDGFGLGRCSRTINAFDYNETGQSYFTSLLADWSFS